LHIFWSRQYSFPFLLSFPVSRLFARFGPLHTPNHLKTKARRNDQSKGIDDGKTCSLKHLYDPDIHDALANALMEAFPFMTSMVPLLISLLQVDPASTG
jgi:hypothetical protein